MTETTTETPRLTRRQAAKIRTADRVLEAARHHFTTVGWAKGTIRAIAQKAGMSTGAVFANYDSKDVLYRAAMGHDPITPEQGRMMALSLLDIALGDMSHEGIAKRAAEAVEAMVDSIPGITAAWEAARLREGEAAE